MEELASTVSAEATFVRNELTQIIGKTSFAYHLRFKIGNVLEEQAAQWSDPNQPGLPAEAFYFEDLYFSILGGWLLDLAWLRNDSGEYVDSSEQKIPPGIEPTYTGAQLLAAYGLWQLNTIGALGDFPKAGQAKNKLGHPSDKVRDYQTDVLLLAYKTLTLTQKLLLVPNPHGEDLARAARAALARKAADASHQETRALKRDAINYWKANIDRTLSNDRAADILKKYVNLSHRKLSEYVGEAKREIKNSGGKA